MRGLNTQTGLYHAPPNTGKRHLQKPTHSPETTFSLKSLKSQWPPKLSQKSNNNTLTTAFRRHTRSTIPHKPLYFIFRVALLSQWKCRIAPLCNASWLVSSAWYDRPSDYTGLMEQLVWPWWHAPKWEVSYLVSSLVKFRPIASNQMFGVPKGSVLRALRFIMYTTQHSHGYWTPTICRWDTGI